MSPNVLTNVDPGDDNDYVHRADAVVNEIVVVLPDIVVQVGISGEIVRVITSSTH